jgi:nitrogenase molybdenum-iron protein alpha/beta subunit
MKSLSILLLLIIAINAVPTEDIVNYQVPGYNYTWYSGMSLFIKDISNSIRENIITFSFSLKKTQIMSPSPGGSTEDQAVLV